MTIKPLLLSTAGSSTCLILQQVLPDIIPETPTFQTNVLTTTPMEESEGSKMHLSRNKYGFVTWEWTSTCVTLSFTTNIYTYCMTNVESPFNICQLCWHTVVHTVWQPVISLSLYIYMDFTCRQKSSLLSPCFWECDSKVTTISLHFNKTIYTRTGTCSYKIHILSLLMSVPLWS